MVPGSVWESDGSRPVDAPVHDGCWYQLKFSSLSSAGAVRGRFYGNVFEVAETDPGKILDLEYISKWVIRSEAGAGKELFTADTDTFVLNDQMLIQGIKAAWADAKELVQADKWLMKFYARMNREIAKTSGAQKISSRPKTTRRDPYYPLYRT